MCMKNVTSLSSATIGIAVSRETESPNRAVHVVNHFGLARRNGVFPFDFKRSSHAPSGVPFAHADPQRRCRKNSGSSSGLSHLQTGDAQNVRFGCCGRNILFNAALTGSALSQRTSACICGVRPPPPSWDSSPLARSAASAAHAATAHATIPPMPPMPPTTPMPPPPPIPPPPRPMPPPPGMPMLLFAPLRFQRRLFRPRRMRQHLVFSYRSICDGSFEFQNSSCDAANAWKQGRRCRHSENTASSNHFVFLRSYCCSYGYRRSPAATTPHSV